MWNHILDLSEFDFKSQVWFQTKIAWHEVQLPLYYNHFEIAEFRQYQYLFDVVAGLLKSGNKKACTSHFLHQTENDATWKWCDLQQKLRNLEHEWRDIEQIWFRSKNSVIRE